MIVVLLVVLVRGEELIIQVPGYLSLPCTVQRRSGPLKTNVPGYRRKSGRKMVHTALSWYHFPDQFQFVPVPGYPVLTPGTRGLSRRLNNQKNHVAAAHDKSERHYPIHPKLVELLFLARAVRVSAATPPIARAPASSATVTGGTVRGWLHPIRTGNLSDLSRISAL
eukprot:368666-Rhodomonas_salina.3